jgi:Mannosyltransferase (PIG-V)
MGWRFCLGAFVALRIGIWLLALIGVGLIPNGGSDKGTPSNFKLPPINGWASVFASLQHNDTYWFLKVATTGYRANDPSAAFFPGYPLAIRSLGFLGHPFFAASLVSNLAFLGALVLLYSLTTQEFGESVARTTIVLLCVFPTSFFFLAPYSESLFLLFSVLAFWAARRDRWVLAAIAAAAAGLTRSVGVLLVPALAFEAYKRSKEDGIALAPRLAAAVAGLSGPLLYFIYWWVRAGDFMMPIHAQSGWNRQTQPPWVTLYQATKGAFSFSARGHGYLLADLAVTLIILVPSLIGLSKLRPSFQVYTWTSLLLPLLYPYPTRPLLSDPRFVLVLFPGFWVLADLCERRRPPLGLVIAVFAAGLGVLSVLFMNSYYVF